VLVQYTTALGVISVHRRTIANLGGVVDSAPEPVRPLSFFSGMSTHTQDLLANPAKCSFDGRREDFAPPMDASI
jgi:hypothetical protein